jgi:hypothetical protein
MLRMRSGTLALLFLPAALLVAAAPDAQLLAPPRPVIVMPQAHPPAAAPGASAPQTHGCLTGGNGYLKAEIRGARNLDLNWRNDELECQGGPRPGSSGLRVAFAGPPLDDGHRLRLVFGVARVHEGKGGRELPTNLTVIFEGEQRLYSTRGDDHCTIDQLRQERLADIGAKRQWRVVARGFCVSPASTLNSDARILVSKFDFAGSVLFGEDPAAPAPRP